MLGLSVVVASAIIFSGLITTIIISYDSLNNGLEALKEATDDRYERGLNTERTDIKILNSSVDSNGNLFINVTNSGETVLNSSKYKIDVVYNGVIVTNDISETRINENPNNFLWTPGSILGIEIPVIAPPFDKGKVVVITDNGIQAFAETGDSEKPTLGVDLSDRNAESGEIVDFSIQVWDNIGIDEVVLTYRYETSGETNNNMIRDSNNLWNYNFTIPSNSDENIFYYITAVDEQGNEVREPTNGEKIIFVTDSISPIFESGSGDFTINNGTSFTIYANFTDNIDVNNAKIYHKRNNTDSWVGHEMAEGVDGEFSINDSTMNINTSGDDTDYNYYIIAYDNNGNGVQSPLTGGSFKIEVT